METMHIAAHGVEVPPGKIESELRKLFSSENPVTRASLMNFAIYSEEEGSLVRNTALLDEVTKEHACRGIVIEMDRNSPYMRLRSWINLHCRLVAGKKSICSEQISFHISGASANLLPNTVLAHLDSDLPLVFWWQGGGLEKLEPELYSRIDRLIIDSGAWGEPLKEFASLERAYRDPNSRFVVLDLGWTRVLALRMALAGCFDFPEAATQVPHFHEIILTAGKNRQLESRLFASWLAAQAGWLLDALEDSATGKFVRKNGPAIRMKFQIGKDPEALPEVEMLSPQARIHLGQEAESGLVSAELQLPSGTTRHRFPGQLLGAADLVTERLRRGCNNKLYFQLIGTVRQLFGEVLRRRD